MSKTPTHYYIQKPLETDIIFGFTEQDALLSARKKLLTYGVFRSYLKTNPFLEEEESYYCFAEFQNRHCLLLENFNSEKFIQNSFFSLESLRQLYQQLPSEEIELLLLGKHLFHWRQQSKFCSQCGYPMVDKEDERARFCKHCHAVQYPRLNPCVIMLVTWGEKLLLARSPHFTPGVYSTLAGFVEPGETLESAVLREVKEEVGIVVKSPQYIGSQPWPFPGSLMVGFFVEYQEGKIVIDPKEIEDAAWFSATNLPQLPTYASIARYLIELFLKRNKG